MTTTAPRITSRRSLLPPNATTLERAIDDATPRWDALADAVRFNEIQPPTSLQPWLAAEWALRPFAQYFDDLPQLLTNGRPWLLQRGSHAALMRALGWVGADDATIDEDEAWLHLMLPHVPSREQVGHILHVTRYTIPTHVKMWRLVHEWDQRRFVLNHSLLNDGLLDDDSGVMVDGIKHSFDLRERQHLGDDTPSTTPAIAALSSAVVEVDHDQGWILNSYTLNTPVVDDSQGVSTPAIALTCTDPETLHDHHAWASWAAYATPSNPENSIDFDHACAHAYQSAHDPANAPEQRWDGAWDTRTWREHTASFRQQITAP